MSEFDKVHSAFETNQPRAAYAGARRAGGMALNAALILEPNDSWGRSYVEHLEALGQDQSVPETVQKAAAYLANATPPGGTMVMLRSKHHDEKLMDATRTVMAHACAVMLLHGAPMPSQVEGENASHEGQDIVKLSNGV